MGEGLSHWGQHRRHEALAIGLLELITSQLCLPKNRAQQTGPNGFAGVMAAFDPYGFETQSMQRIEQLLACERWPLAHASTQTR
jgi:hypothetical protein